mgnify:CR=1 FL=1
MGFVEDYWLEIVSLSLSLLAMAVSLYSLYLKRLDIERERLAREITFGPLDETMVIDRDAIDEAYAELTGGSDTQVEKWIAELRMRLGVSDSRVAGR